jgi:hypothetical protein
VAICVATDAGVPANRVAPLEIVTSFDVSRLAPQDPQNFWPGEDGV